MVRKTLAILLFIDIYLLFRNKAADRMAGSALGGTDKQIGEQEISSHSTGL